MRQILLNDKGALIARMPRPSVEPGKILVRVKYSMISMGTELATLRNSNQAESTPPLEKAKQQSKIAFNYLGKAIRHPKKATQRVQRILQNSLANMRPQKQQEPIRVAVENLVWQKSAAQTMQADATGLRLQTDNSVGNYQAISSIIEIPEGYAPAIDVQGSVKGRVLIGLLDEAKSRWLGNKIFGEGTIDDQIILPTDGIGRATVVIANADAPNSEVSLDHIAVSLVSPCESGLPHSEQQDQGWNVGYSLAGEVIACGPGVTGFVVGDVVACAGAGIANHADFVAVPENLASRIPANCDLKSASSTTIGAIALQGVRRADPKLSEIIAVVGLGLLGQITVQLLKANGCKVIGLDLNVKRVAKSKQLGLDLAFSDPGEFNKAIRDLTKGHGVDQTLITAATKSNAVINSAMQITRRKGKVVIVGDVGLDIERPQFYKKEIDLLMSTSYGPGRYDYDYEFNGRDYPYAYVRWTMQRNMQAYLQLIADGQICISDFIEQTVAVEQAPELYSQLASTSQDLPLAAVIEYPDDERSLPEAFNASYVKPKGARKSAKGVANYALVGAGAFGTCMLVPQMDKLQQYFFLRGIVSRDSTRGGNFARSKGLELHTSKLDDVLNNSEIDLVVIATRHNDHAEQVIQALKAGKHVFVEKPLALTWEELDQVAKVYNELPEKPVLMVGFNRRFSPAMRVLKEILANRRSPLTMQYRLNGGYIPLDHWIQTSEGGGRNIGEACHMYDCLRYLADSAVADISASAINPGELAYLPSDNFIATMQYSDGSVGSLTYTALGPKAGLPKERLEVFCDGEAYILDDYCSLIRASDQEVLWSGEADKGHFTELSELGKGLAIGSAPIEIDEIMESSAVALRVEDLLYGRF